MQPNRCRSICAFVIAASLVALSFPRAAEAQTARPVYPAADRYLEEGTAFGWRGVEGAASYVVEICADAACAQVVQRGTANSTYWQPAPLARGSYFWRVTAVNANGSRGASSAPVRFHVGLTISGTVFEDRAALGLRDYFSPIAGATVRLFRDGGDGVPTADDAVVSSSRTESDGTYIVDAESAGTFWVVVDSKSLRAGAWGEQTFGAAGSLCTTMQRPAVVLTVPGPCIGGRSTASDDASSLTTAEHVTRVVARTSMANVSFAFSFDAVTSLADWGEKEPAVQGSLRQFLTNANTIAGPNAMRFLPLVESKIPEGERSVAGVPPQWWTIAVVRPLPELTDAATTLSGKAYNILSPASAFETNPGRIGQRPTVHGEEAEADRNLIELPELELVAAGGEALVCVKSCNLDHLAIRGAETALTLRDGGTVDQVLIGSRPDTLLIGQAASIGIAIEHGRAVVRDTFITAQRTVGIAVVNRDAKLEAERAMIDRCGTPGQGAGILLQADGSVVRRSRIRSNYGAGIVIGSTDGSQPGHENRIEECILSDNLAGIVLSAGSSGNLITRNVLTWNASGGVVVGPYGAAPPVSNRISTNRYNENGGRPVVLDLEGDRNELRASETCRRVPTAANRGLGSPIVNSAVATELNGQHVIVVRGRGCPGLAIELYQSYATSALRDKDKEEARRVRLGDQPTGIRESIVVTRRGDPQLPSVGEFNYVSTTLAKADGTFEVIVPYVTPREAEQRVRERSDQLNNEFEVTADEVFRALDPLDTSFSALSIDAEGNTSELSTRKIVARRE